MGAIAATLRRCITVDAIESGFSSMKYREWSVRSLHIAEYFQYLQSGLNTKWVNRERYNVVLVTMHGGDFRWEHRGCPCFFELPYIMGVSCRVRRLRRDHAYLGHRARSARSGRIFRFDAGHLEFDFSAPGTRSKSQAC